MAHEKTEEALRLMRAKQAVAEEEKAETQRQVAALQAKLAAAKALEHEQEMSAFSQFFFACDLSTSPR